LALVTEQGYKLSEAARSVGIWDYLIRHWKRELEQEASGAQLGADEQQELKRPERCSHTADEERGFKKKPVRTSWRK